MSWYYAGPEARPVGPITLDELQARRASGAIGAETYVIEHTGQPGTTGSWRKYRELFPQGVMVSSLPPLPQATPPVLPPPVPAPHALFPSAGAAPLPAPTYTPNLAPQASLQASPHGYYPVRRTNGWCSWGFGLAIAGFILSLFCGIGAFLAAPALLICLVGVIQASPPQSGRGLAVAGGMLAVLGLIISICFLSYLVPLVMKQREEASSQSSE